jgi:hypothetical protein
MRPLLFAVIWLSTMFLLEPTVATQAVATAARCPFKDMAQVVVKGIARSIKSGAQEPGESINTYFYLETAGPPCGRSRISVFAAGIIPCMDGDKATVRGVFYAPGEPPFDEPMIDLATVACGASR